MRSATIQYSSGSSPSRKPCFTGPGPYGDSPAHGPITARRCDIDPRAPHRIARSGARSVGSESPWAAISASTIPAY